MNTCSQSSVIELGVADMRGGGGGDVLPGLHAFSSVNIKAAMC